MSVFETMETARNEADIQAYSDLMAEDFVFVRHQNGTTLNKSETKEMLTNMMSAGGAFGATRCIYENDDILVTHSVNDYPDGTREAVLAAYTIKDGKVTRLETGATKLT